MHIYSCHHFGVQLLASHTFAEQLVGQLMWALSMIYTHEGGLVCCWHLVESLNLWEGFILPGWYLSFWFGWLRGLEETNPHFVCTAIL